MVPPPSRALLLDGSGGVGGGGGVSARAAICSPHRSLYLSEGNSSDDGLNMNPTLSLSLSLSLLHVDFIPTDGRRRLGHGALHGSISSATLRCAAGGCCSILQGDPICIDSLMPFEIKLMIIPELKVKSRWNASLFQFTSESKIELRRESTLQL